MPSSRTNAITTRSQLTVDPSAPTDTILSQPSLWMAGASMIPVYLAHLNPRDWLAKPHVGTLINGIRAEQYLFMPFSTCTLMYCWAADHVMQGQLIPAHVVGLTTSLAAGLTCFYFHYVSLWYVATGFCFCTFGMTHHRNNLKIFSDNAPLFHFSDFREIYRDWSAKRKARKAKQKAQKANQ